MRLLAVLIGAAAISAGAWLLLRVGGPDPLVDVEAQLAAIRTAHPHGSGSAAPATSLIASLFPPATGSDAATDVAVELQGISRFNGRSAALLSIGGQPPEWLEEGRTRDRVTLRQVLASKVVVDTAIGYKEVPLGNAADSKSPTSSSQ